MPITAWTKDLECGHPTIDAQHQGLIRMVNELHDAIIAGHGKEVLGPVLGKLVRYTVEHFQTEEKIMQDRQYPAFARHKARHDALASQASQLMEQFSSGQVLLSMTVSRFLADWVKHHIHEEDQDLVAFLRK